MRAEDNNALDFSTTKKEKGKILKISILEIYKNNMKEIVNPF